MNLVWGPADSAKGKCSGSSLLIKLSGEVSREQAFASLEDKWPYNVCRKEAEGKAFVPYTQACYETSRQLSTLRNYQATVKFENVSFKIFSFKYFSSFINLFLLKDSSKFNCDIFTIGLNCFENLADARYYFNKSFFSYHKIY